MACSIAPRQSHPRRVNIARTSMALQHSPAHCCDKESSAAAQEQCGSPVPAVSVPSQVPTCCWLVARRGVLPPIEFHRRLLFVTPSPPPPSTFRPLPPLPPLFALPFSSVTRPSSPRPPLVLRRAAFVSLLAPKSCSPATHHFRPRNRPPPPALAVLRLGATRPESKNHLWSRLYSSCTNHSSLRCLSTGAAQRAYCLLCLTGLCGALFVVARIQSAIWLARCCSSPAKQVSKRAKRVLVSSSLLHADSRRPSHTNTLPAQQCTHTCASSLLRPHPAKHSSNVRTPLRGLFYARGSSQRPWPASARLDHTTYPHC